MSSQTSAGPNGPSAAPATPAPSPSQPPAKRRPVLLAIAAAAVIAAGAYGAHWWTVGRFIETTDDAYLKADSVTAAPKVGGYVTQVFVVANQAVKRGDPLVKLDARQYQAAADQSQATIDGRKADIHRYEADILQQQAQLAQTRAQADASRLALAHAQDEVTRHTPLAVSGATSAERLAELRNNRDQAAASLAAAEAAVKAADGRLKSSQAQVAQSKAQVEAAEAALRQNHLDVDDTVVRAAIDGRVGDTTVRVGQFAQPGTRLMTIVPTQDIYLVANFKETQIGRMRAGQPVTLHVDALPDADVRGTVESFSPGTGAQFALLPSENATGNFTKIVQRVPVRIRVQADPALRERLLPGLSVTTEVDTRGDGGPARDAAPRSADAGARHG
ncbi:HlyD family secretion protein [Mitsuaria sp. GD03876]|uniref:HlyD family secretion protein n=1 Tax=Mitsuaria sp. GD03876 TaxID=2975399 RepID=UPI002447A8E6|nr:HlyD family secretion protein [Mitsuaria sp. GD03876]MDH0863228.1 HlyD family secretion protein [Mitsuaria sp. GD03876]